jgi:hypothetical protein
LLLSKKRNIRASTNLLIGLFCYYHDSVIELQSKTRPFGQGLELLLLMTMYEIA